jgi:hypothetical protein
MKIKMTCNVEPNVKANALVAELGDWRYHFVANEDGLVEKITIETSVPDYKKYQMCIENAPTPDNPKGRNIRFSFDHDFNDILIQEFQYIEGMLSLLGNPVSISWQSPFMELIPENEQEKPHGIEAFRMERIPPVEEPVEMSDQNINYMISKAHIHSQIMNPFLSFFREAIKEQAAFRFINSFFNAYFILEGAYGNKKWRNWQIKEEFKKSADFKRFAENAISRYAKKNARVEWKLNNMLSELKDRHGSPLNAKLDADGIAALLVDTRGALHHFSGDVKVSKGIPSNHQDFEELADFTIRIAGETLFEMLDEIDAHVEKLRKESATKRMRKPKS